MAALRRGSALVLAFALVLSVVAIMGILPGCSDDDATCPTAAGTIKGTILTAGNPVGARLRAWFLPDSGQHVSYIQDARTDSMGVYSLDVPPGNYRLQVSSSRCGRYYAHGILVESSADAETLVVQAGKTITADVNSGSMRIELDLHGGPSGTAFVALSDVDKRCTLVSDPVQIQGAHATFEVSQVPPGTYRMVLEIVSGGRVWLPGVLNMAEADTITIAAGQQRTYQASLPQAAVLHGTVTGSWQELGTSIPWVRLYDPNGTFGYDSAPVSSTDGTYTFRLYGWVHALMKISIDGTDSWYGGAAMTDALPIDIAPGQTKEVNIRESGIAGWLHRQPSPYNPRLVLWNLDGTERADGPASGPDGYFHISNLQPGSYYLSIPSGPDWIEQWYDRADSLADAAPIQITEEGEIVWLDIDLVDGGKIEGRLLRGDGTPAYGAHVYLLAAEAENAIQTATSNGVGGAFSIMALQDGDYRLAADANGVEGQAYYPGVTDPAQAEILSIRDHASITGIVFQLP